MTKDLKKTASTERANTSIASGKFISFEGIDGAGKTSNINALANYLREQGKTVYLTREPGGTKLGEKIREIVLQGHSLSIIDDAELLLMFAARVQHLHEVIKPKIEAGVWVLSDRFVDASFAYQGAGRGVDLSRMQALSEWSLQSYYPDLTVIFDISVALSVERMMARHEVVVSDTSNAINKLDRFEQQKLDFKHRVNDYYLGLASTKERQYFHLDASQDLASVKDSLLNEIANRWFV